MDFITDRATPGSDLILNNRLQPNVEANKNSTSLAKNVPFETFGIYSRSGFDLVGVLAKMANRPNPTIQVGPVDSSCSFVICDAKGPDIPILYVSETFEQMTGYSGDEIIGRNCRFLQFPPSDFKIQTLDTKRTVTNEFIAQQIRKNLSNFKECQHTLINYRKNGSSFVNLLTLIPISWKTENEYDYIIGLQTDLSHKVGAIMKNKMLPDVENNYGSKVLTFPCEYRSSNQGESFVKFLLPMFVDTLSDLIFIVSSCGKILFASPNSCLQILEYCYQEIIGKALDEFVHQLDMSAIIELLGSMTAESGKDVITMSRFRRRYSGYIFLELKCRKYLNDELSCFIMTARAIPIGVVPVESITLPTGNINDESIGLMKISPEGLIMYASKAAGLILGYCTDQLLSLSFYEFISDEDVTLLYRAILFLISSNVPYIDCKARIVNFKNCFHVNIRFINPNTPKIDFIYIQIRTCDTLGVGGFIMPSNLSLNMFHFNLASLDLSRNNLIQTQRNLETDNMNLHKELEHLKALKENKIN